MDSTQKYDVIVVGLGCVGLSTTYYWSKMGLKVLGLEMNSTSGEIGTSSAGTTRIYRFTSPVPIQNEMMKVAKAIWDKTETELKDLKSADSKFSDIETELLTSCDLLTFGNKDSPDLISMLDNIPNAKLMNSYEIAEKYPGFENLPDSFIGCVTNDAGVVRVKNALNGFRILSIKNGADLIYISPVSEVSKNHVQWSNGNVYYADNVVVSWGGYTKESFDVNDTKSKVIETETFTFGGGRKGLPGCFIEINGELRVYGLMDSQDLTDYKFGLHEERNLKVATKYARERFTSKMKDLKYTAACMYTITDDGNFIYKTNPDGVHYCYGLNGQGFKYMPTHGKIIYDGLITGKDKSFIIKAKSKL